MKRVVHRIAGMAALSTVATFWFSTLISELFLDAAAVAAVKHAIARYGLALLILAMAAAGASGFALAKAREGRLLQKKKRRMPILAINGLLVMVPAAIFLDRRAAAGLYDAMFHAVQLIELSVGLAQLILLGLNVRDGRVLGGRRRPAQAPANPDAR